MRKAQQQVSPHDGVNLVLASEESKGETDDKAE